MQSGQSETCLATHVNKCGYILVRIQSRLHKVMLYLSVQFNLLTFIATSEAKYNLVLVMFTADKAVSIEQASCYRFISPGSCSHPLAQKITKQICCCSRVGKAWGSACERCPVPDTGMSSL